MKRFLILLWVITLLGCWILSSRLFFDAPTLLYHIVVVMIFQIGYVFIVALTGFIHNFRIRNRIVQLGSFIFLLCYVLFYLSVIGSNALWGKTITFRILADYFLSLNELVEVLPVDGWIFYTAIILIISILFVIYWFTRPRNIQQFSFVELMNKARPSSRKWIIGVAGTILLFVIFVNPLLQLKRKAHFAGEPVMEFAWGPMWYPESLDDIYSPAKQKNSLKEAACIETVVKNKELPGHTSVVILVDALRPDHLPMYGYHRMTAPFLDSLHRAQKLLAVKHAFSTSSGTLIGVAGLFSSRNWDNFGYTGLSLMKFMRRTGHDTYAFLTGHHRTWYGLTAIYRNDTEFFYESATSYTQIDLDDLTTLQKFEETPISKQSFVYMHLLSTHDLGKKAAAFKKFLPDKIGLGVGKKTALINNYDNGILQVDHIVRKVFEKLRKEGNLENATIYIVSDHGQLFGEYGQWNHASSINPTVVSVPMLVFDSKPEWYQNREVATLKDVAPSLARRVGYDIPACWEGHSLGLPAYSFTSKINIENKCEIPEAELRYQQDTLWLNHFSPTGQLVGKAYLPKDSTLWKFTQPLP